MFKQYIVYSIYAMLISKLIGWQLSILDVANKNTMHYYTMILTDM